MLPAKPIAIALLSLASGLPAQTSQLSPAAAKPLTIRQVWTLDATYTDAKHGVTFRYPSIWQPQTQFAYHPPALTSSDVQPTAGFGYEEDGFPREKVVGPYSKTNLEGFGIVYSARPASNAAQCKSIAARIADSAAKSSARFQGRRFTVYETDEYGMNQNTQGHLYASYAGRTCYLFETSVGAASPDVADDISPLSAAQSSSIDTGLSRIMQSVHIQPK